MMTPFLIEIVLVLAVLYIYLRFLFVRKKTAAEDGICNENQVNHVTEKCLPLPQISLIDILWTKLFRKGRMVRFLERICKIGPITEFQFWSSRYVFINDYQLGLQILKDPVSNGRPMFTPRSHYGISGAYGKNWKDQRKFCLRHLKALGFGTKSMESIVQEEVNVLIESWCNLKGKRFSPNKAFYVPVLNTIWKICTGERIALEDQELFRQICISYECLLRLYTFPNFITVSLVKIKSISWLIKWIPVFTVARNITRGIAKMRFYIRNAIGSKKNVWNSEQMPENLIEAYLSKIKETVDVDSNFFGTSGDMNLQAVIMDFFLAGGDTTATTLVWAMLHLVRNPQVQEKIHTEIENIVGFVRRPELTDRINCPYTEAFIWEVLRFSPIGLVTFPHTCSEDINVGQHVIRKKSLILLNIYSIQHNVNAFGDPQNFRPERFLNSDETALVKNDALCTFSIGQRRCLGEHVARDSLFLFISAICQRFYLKPDPLLGGKVPLLRDRKSAIHAPETFFMIATERRNDLEKSLAETQNMHGNTYRG